MTAQTILPANTLSSGYDVANSVRLNGADSAKFNIDHSGEGSRVLWTLSMWVKRSGLGAEEPLFNSRPNSNFETFCGFAADDTLVFKQKNDGSTSGQYVTNRKFRDISAWYHFVFVYDKDNSTAGNRGRIYVNGVEETSFSTESNFSDSSTWNSTNTNNIGNSQSAYFDGYMCEVVFIDGQALAPTSFGEFDEDSPQIWKPIDVSGLTPGTNGFWLNFEDSSNLGNNAFGSGSADWTETNIAATDQSTDTCTNNYSTLNPIFNNIANLTYSEGNLNVVASDANYRSTVSTIGVSQGKWYAEFKAVSGFNSTDKAVGIYRSDTVFVATTGLGNFTTGFTFSYGATGNVRTNNGNNDTGEATFTDGDIIQVAMDLDNNKLYFGKNNTYINSGDPTTGSTGTGAYSITASTGEVFYFAVASISSGGAALWSCNFGSPSYANSSDASDANGYGAFEFAPPSGYYALNTKNLAEYG